MSMLGSLRLLSLLSAGAIVFAQPGPYRPAMNGGGPPGFGHEQGPPPPRGGGDRGGPPMDRNRPPMERPVGSERRWWTDPGIVQQLGLSTAQQGKIDTIFQQSRLKLIDLSGALQKEEAMLEPLLEAEQPDEAKVVSQIDRIAQARGELEKANARMLLGFRGVLTLDQWKKLQAGSPPGGPRDGRRP